MKPIKHTPRRHFVALASLLLLGACGEAVEGGPPGLSREPPAASTYLDPPQILALAEQAGTVALRGQAAPEAQIRLATPEGEEHFAVAGEDGAWSLTLPAAPEPRIFGLSMTADGRTAQAEGYQLVLPDNRLVRLRAGAGAVVVIDGEAAPALTAFDFDEEGGAVVSGRAPAEAAFTVRIDGRPVATNGRADAQGRFSLPFGAPVPPGQHQIEVQGEGFTLSETVDATPALPPASGAFRARETPLGLRIDWLTPGGGLQSTLLPSDGAR